MRRTTRAGTLAGAALLVGLGLSLTPASHAQTPVDGEKREAQRKTDEAKRLTESNQSRELLRERAAKAPADGTGTGTNHEGTETIHGIVAGVTVAGEMDVEPGADRARVVEASYLTIVGSPGASWDGHGHAQANAAHPNANAPNAAQGNAPHANANANDPTAGQRNVPNAAHHGRHRHNVYNVWLTPKTEVIDQHKGEPNQPGQGANAGQATAPKAAPANADAPNDLAHLQADLDKLEVGDRVEVVFRRKETGKTGATPRARAGRTAMAATASTSATPPGSTIVAGPSMGEPGQSSAAPGDHGRRDDDRDKTQNANPGDTGSKGAGQPSEPQKKG